MCVDDKLTTPSTQATTKKFGFAYYKWWEVEMKKS